MAQIDWLGSYRSLLAHAGFAAVNLKRSSSPVMHELDANWKQKLEQMRFTAAQVQCKTDEEPRKQLLYSCERAILISLRKGKGRLTELDRYPLLAIRVQVDLGDEKSNTPFRLVAQFPNTVMLNPDYLRCSYEDRDPRRVLGDVKTWIDCLHHQPPVSDSLTDWLGHAEQAIWTLAGGDWKHILEMQIRARRQPLNWVVEVRDFKDAAATRSIDDLYAGLQSDGATAWAQSTLPLALAAHTGAPQGLPLKTDDFLYILQGNSDYLLGHMEFHASGSDGEGAITRELHPLDNTQRHAVIAAHLATQIRAGQAAVIAVNGPPGSGKTAMLKAIVAHEWVRAACEGGLCPIILAIGATNISVTNVISAFPGVARPERPESSGRALLAERWLPHCVSYGSYYPSKTALENLPPTIAMNTMLLQRAGGMSHNLWQWRDQAASLAQIETLPQLEQAYLTKAVRYLQNPLRVEGGAGDGADHGTQEGVRSSVEDNALNGGRDGPDKGLGNGAVPSVKQVVAELQTQLLTRRAQLGLSNRRLRQALHSGQTDVIGQLLTDPGTVQWSVLLAKVRSFCLGGEDALKVYRELCRERIRDENLTEDDFALRLREDVVELLAEQLLELTLRAEMFHLAARYWEGRYLLDCRRELLFASTRRNVVLALRRVCMLTPCLVATCHQAPKLLEIRSFDDGEDRRHFAYGVVDCLITDETGQADLRLGVPLLALARKVIAVGDVQQLEPVAEGLTVAEEYQTLRQHGLPPEHYAELYQNGLCVTHGSLLHLLRRASSLHYQGLGIPLRGHYRCHPDIIQYCNQTFYANELFVAGFLRKASAPFSAVSYVPSTTVDQRDPAGSRINRGEAAAIVDFVCHNWAQISINQSDPGKRLAIVSPFNSQAELIRNRLRERAKQADAAFTLEQIKGVVVDTVHALQGVEMDIVIFSGTQTAKAGRTVEQPFYENQPFLLNVAVSRAKLCFIAFVCPQIYGFHLRQQVLPKHATHLQRLGHYLCNHGVRLLPRHLVVVEAPGKVATLQGMLGPEYLVMATHGNLANLGLGVAALDGNAHLKPSYELRDNAKVILQQIRAALPGLQRLYVATDDDYVGEAIAWHLFENLKQDLQREGIEARRMRLRAIRKEAVSSALQQADALPAVIPGRGLAGLSITRVAAEVARDACDALISTYLGSLLGRGKGCGRVRAGVLDLLYQRQRLIAAEAANTTKLQVRLEVNGKTLLGKIVIDDPDRQQLVEKRYVEQVVSEGRIVLSVQGWNNPELSHTNENHYPPARSTLEVMRVAWQRHRLKPAAVAEALNQLYLGKAN